MKIYFQFLLTLLLSQSVFATQQTITLYNSAGTAASYCSDANGVRNDPNTGGVLATGVTAGACIVNTPPASCTTGRQNTVGITWNGDFSGVVTTSALMLDPIFGRLSPTSSIVSMPWYSGFRGFANLSKTGYLAMQFTVPANISPTAYGLIYRGETYPGPNMTATISQSCGDFTATPLCHSNPGGPGQGLLKWKMLNAPGVGCVLQPGQTYFLNIKMTNPAEVNPACGATSCRMSLSLVG